jgi:hypothetical protein
LLATEREIWNKSVVTKEELQDKKKDKIMKELRLLKQECNVRRNQTIETVKKNIEDNNRN